VRLTPSQLVVLWMAGFMASVFTIGMLEGQARFRLAGRVLVALILGGLLLATLLRRRNPRGG